MLPAKKHRQRAINLLIVFLHDKTRAKKKGWLMSRTKTPNTAGLPAEKLVSIVLSFINEQEVIPELVQRIRKVFDDLPQYRCEMIFVNDNSTDKSLQILKEQAEGRDDIKILNMSRTFGVSPCVIAGMEYSSGDAVIYMDADLQDPPETIPKMIKKWENRADVVHTVRLSRAGETRIKLWITKIGYRILKCVSSVDLIMNAGDFKLLSRRAVDEVIKLKEKRPFMRGLVSWVGFDQARVPYHRDARRGGKTKFHIFSSKVINNFLDSALISFSDVPLKIFVILGTLISFFSFLYLPYLGFKAILGFSVPEGFLLITAFFFLEGMILLGIGVLGLYISSIFLETKGRHNYIVKDTYGFEDESPKNQKQ